MSVKVRKMTDEEFEYFCQWSIADHAKELMEECHISQGAATEEAEKEIARMLPDGLNTELNQLMTIEDSDRSISVGFIWTLHEETEGRKQSFICDFAVWKPERRNGYAMAALHLAEKAAAEAGCQESVLFVADQNDAAKALYHKCGYQFLRQSGCGKYMKKQLSGSPCSKDS